MEYGQKMTAVKNNNNRPRNRLLFFSVKLPATYFLMTLGLLIDFVIQFPLALICTLENRFVRRPR
jgi:hypothetical protein